MPAELTVSPNLTAAVREVLAQGPRAVAVAYVGPAAPTEVLDLLAAGDVLICDASDATLASGGTAPVVLRALRDKGVRVYSNPRLHAKVYVGADQALVSSGNLSQQSAGNLEAGVRLSDRKSVTAARAFVTGLVDHLKTDVVDETFLDLADAVYLPPRTSSAPTPTATGRLRIATYRHNVGSRLEKFAEARYSDVAEAGSGLVDFCVSDGREFRVGDRVVFVEHDATRPQQEWWTTAPGVCERKLAVGDAAGNWVYYWRYPVADELPWATVAKSVAYHAGGYELRLDSTVRRSDVMAALDLKFPAPQSDLAVPMSTTVEGLLEVLGVADLDLLKDRVEDATCTMPLLEPWEDGLAVVLMIGAGSVSETIDYGTSSEDFWTLVDELEVRGRTLDAYWDLASQIEEVEGFPVTLLGPPDGLERYPELDWPYQRAARSTWTFGRWLEARLETAFPGVTAAPLDTGGIPVRRNTRLSTLRARAVNGELLESQFDGEQWVL